MINRCPPDFNSFVLVDDDGELLNCGTPTDTGIPNIRQRMMNYEAVKNSKYATAAEKNKS